MHTLKHKILQVISGAAVFTALVAPLVAVQAATAATPPLQTFAAGNFEGECDGSIDKDNCGIVAYIVTFTQILSAAVGIIVTIMIVWGGIKYSMSKDNPQETAAAKGIIRNAIIALVFYFFTLAFLNSVVPGGVL